MIAFLHLTKEIFEKSRTLQKTELIHDFFKKIGQTYNLVIGL